MLVFKLFTLDHQSMSLKSIIFAYSYVLFKFFFLICRKVVRQSIINPDWDFNKMGIGGLSNEFNAIFRRAFASRVFPPELVEQLGCKHVKGTVHKW